jgi:hypothetical protein
MLIGRLLHHKLSGPPDKIYSIMIRYLTLFPLVIVLLFSCTSAPEVEIPDEIASLENLTVISTSISEVPELHIERVTRYGDTDEVIIGRMGVVAVDDVGRVYIADNSRNLIHVYEPNGSYLTQIGGEGDGPGEFRWITSVVPHGDFIHVMDRSSMRISRFHKDDYGFAEDVKIPSGGDNDGRYLPYPTRLSVIDSDHYMIHFGVGITVNSASEPMIAGKVLSGKDGTFEEDITYIFPANKAIIDRAGGSQRMMAVDYKRSSHLAMDDSSNIIHGWTENLLFKYYDAEGAYQKAVYVPYEKAPLNRNDVLAEYTDVADPWISMLRNDEMPDTWPAFRKMVADDKGRIWVSLITSDPETYTWLVIDPASGQATGSIIRARGQWSIIDVMGSNLFAGEINAESGLMEVAKYKIHF